MRILKNMKGSEALKSLYQGIIAVLRTFPVEVVNIIIIYCCVYININSAHNNWKTDQLLYTRISETAVLVTLSILFSTLALINKTSVIYRYVIQVVLAVCLFSAFYQFLDTPGKILSDLRFVFLLVSLHFTVSFALFTKKTSNKIFWAFNKILFIRILSAFLYSAVMIAGLNLAMSSFTYLFNVEIRAEFYSNLDTFILIVFNILYFLSGIPLSSDAIEKELEYPASLRNFTQYVLLPLITIYFLILISYSGKILVLFVLPKGKVSLMILLYALFGNLSMLLVFPLRSEQRYAWFKLFSRYFFWTLIPLNILLYLAIFRRINEYGLTEYRYAVLILAVWISGITAYFIAVKEPQIKVIPITLFITGMICLFFPFNAFNTSRSSQLNFLTHSVKESARKKQTFAKNKNPENLRPDIIYFLYSRYSYSIFQPFTNIKLKVVHDQQLKDIMKNGNNSYSIDSKMIDTINSMLFGNNRMIVRLPVHSFIQGSINLKEEPRIEISGFDRSYLNYYYHDFISHDTISKKDRIVLTRNPRQTNLILSVKGDSMPLSIRPFFFKIRNSDTVIKDSNVPQIQSPYQSPIILYGKSKKHQAKVQFIDADFIYEKDTVRFNKSETVILIKDMN